MTKVKVLEKKVKLQGQGKIKGFAIEGIHM
jgi:hypothetical protein